MCILKCVWMCYTKCLHYDVGTHMYELCVCVLTPCKRIEVEVYLWHFHLLKTIFALDVALQLWSFFSSKNILSNNYYKYRAFCNGIKPIQIMNLTISPLGYSMVKPHPHHTMFHSNKLNVDSILSSSHYKEIPRLKGLQVFLSLQEFLFGLQRTYERK